MSIISPTDPELVARDAPRIRSLRARAVDVPLPKPHPTAGGVLTSAPLVLIDLTTDDGVVGRSYVFTYTVLALAATCRLIEDVAGVVVGQSLAPFRIARTLQTRFRLLGAQGLAAMAAGGIDMAAWDALARTRGLPLCELLGGEPQVQAAYQSLGMATLEDGPREALDAAAAGYSGLKFKIGGANARADSTFVRAVRDAIGPDMDLMVDYNQSLDAAEAIRRGRALQEYNLTWIEEPCAADDDVGHATVAAALDTPIVFGENWWSPHETARAIAAGACDEVMLDVMKIGGVTGWLAAASVAAAAGQRISSHLFPEFSAHLLAVTPGAHYLEWLDLASPILEDALRPREGKISIDRRPGAALTWDEAAIARYTLG
jgi:mandelate racemase